MPRKARDVTQQWYYRGRRVGIIRNGTYVIDRYVSGHRMKRSTGCLTADVAAHEFERFEQDPTVYISRVAPSPRAEALRKNHLRRVYNLAPEKHAALREAQGGRCAICQQPGKLQVDHDHATGVIRGLLCGRCNRALGQLGDSVEILERAIEYLEKARDVVPRLSHAPEASVAPDGESPETIAMLGS